MIKKIFIIIAMCLLLTSCGFQLRKSFNLSPKLENTYVASDTTYNELANRLRRQLISAGNKLSNNTTDASSIINLNNIQKTQSNTGLDGNQTTQIISLTESVNFNVTTPAGVILVPTQTVSATRLLTAQSSSIISDVDQENVMYQAIERELVEDILDRLASKNTTEALAKSPMSKEKTSVKKIS